MKLNSDDLIYIVLLIGTFLIANIVLQIIYISLLATIYLNNGSRTNLQNRTKSKRTGNTTSITSSSTLSPIS